MRDARTVTILQTTDDVKRRSDWWWFGLTVLCTSGLHLMLHVAAYGLVLRHVYRAYPSGTPDFVHQLQRPAADLVVWAMIATTVTMGLFITTVMGWSGARTFGEGIKRGVQLGVLFWTAVNSGLYASSHLFSLPSVLVDTPLSALCMALASALAAVMLHAAPGGWSRPVGHGV